MREVSYLIALVGVVFLGMALFARLRIFRKSDQQMATRKGLRRSESAAMVIVIAFVLCLAAAAVGIVGWIVR
jgi:uncharacterized membrane protein YidH (DUF202 family)